MNVVAAGDHLIVTIGRRKTEVRIEPTTAHFATATLDGRRIDFAWCRGENGYTLLIDGIPHEVEMRDPREELANAATGRDRKADKDARVVAPIPGLVTRILVQIGEKVKKGRPIICLDAMKLENEIPSPRDGVIQSIDVEPGRPVEKGQTLFVVG